MAEFRAEVKVIFYSGYKGRETPRAIIFEDREYPVEEVLSRKRVLEKESGEHAEIFRCRVAGKDITLKIGPSGEGRILGPGLDSLPPHD